MKTRTCKKWKHREFSFWFDPKRTLEQDVQWLRLLLESSVAEGERYRPGDTIQTGWILNLLKERKDGTLGIYEPDFRSMPIVWVDGVNNTLTQLRFQKDVVESVEVGEPLFPSIRESCLLGTDLDGGESSVFLERSKPQRSNSGWFIGCKEPKVNYDDPNKIVQLSLYEAAIFLPKIIMFLALPSHTRVVLFDGQIHLTTSGKALVPRPNSFLERFQEKKKGPG